MCLPPIYWILSCCSEVNVYLNHVLALQKVIKKIEKARKAAPEISFNIECYHDSGDSEEITHEAS